MSNSWDLYYEQTVVMEARSTVKYAISAFSAAGINHGTAVDLGCGVGNDTLELLKHGWKVHAIDRERSSIKSVVTRASQEEMSRLSVSMTEIEIAEWDSCDLFNASLVLPFCQASAFTRVWDKIQGSLNSGGRFAGHFLGLNDEWCKAGSTLHVGETELRDLFRSFSLELLESNETDMPYMGSSKRWHIWSVVAQLKQ